MTQPKSVTPIVRKDMPLRVVLREYSIPESRTIMFYIIKAISYEILHSVSFFSLKNEDQYLTINN